jgi:HEAT repeat protein
MVGVGMWKGFRNVSSQGLSFRFALTAGCVLAALPPCGCSLRSDFPLQPLPTSAAQDPPAKGVSRDANAASSHAEVAAENGKPDTPRGLMTQGGWYRRPFTTEEAASGVYNDGPAIPENIDSPAVFRYRHAGVEQFVARPAVEQTAILSLVADNDRNVAVSAAIALARQGDAKAAARLVAAIEDEELPLAARCAAVEALGRLPGDGQTATLGRLADRFGKFRPGESAGYQTDLHAELLRALARHVDAADDPRFIAAAAASAPVRIETLRAWSVSKHGSMPLEVIDLRADNDPRVRAMAMTALAAKQPAEAFDDLKSALREVDLSVRLAAIRGLGQLPGEPSQAVLADVLKDRAELLRAEAVAAIAVHGPRAAVLGAAGDKSWRVRLKVAEVLANYGDLEGASVARRLLDDPSAEVSRQVVRSVAGWPWEVAAPVLLDALSKNTITVRKVAADQVAARWPGTVYSGSPGRFPFDGTPARRAEALGRLQALYQREWGAGGKEEGGRRKDEPRFHPSSFILHPFPSDAQVERLLAAGDMKALAEIGPPVVAALERLAVEQDRTLPEPVYRDVLAPLSPVFAGLDRLHSDNLDQRRRAVEELAAAAGKQSLGRLAVARLCALNAAETDTAVWLGALAAVRDCGLEPAVRMARSALGQPAAEVRRRACEHLEAHPDAAHEVFLAPLVNDPDQAVAAAAIRAIGAAGQVRDRSLLKNQLASANEEVQLEAAIALVRVGDRGGEGAIERLSYSGDLMTRFRVAQSLGGLGDSRLTGVLIRLLDDSKATVSHAALASLPLVAGRDLGRSADGTTASTTEQVARWKKWWAETPR